MRTRAMGVLPLLVLVAGCQSAPPPATQDSAIKTLKRDYGLVIVRFLDKETLKTRYGDPHNPFIPVARIVTPQSFLVFKLNLEEASRPLRIVRRDIELQFGSKHASPLSVFNLQQYWELEDQSTDIMPAAQRRRDEFIRQETLPDELKLAAGSRASGVMVFSAGFPRYGDARLYIPVLDDVGRLVERLEIDFRF